MTRSQEGPNWPVLGDWTGTGVHWRQTQGGRGGLHLHSQPSPGSCCLLLGQPRVKSKVTVKGLEEVQGHGGIGATREEAQGTSSGVREACPSSPSAPRGLGKVHGKPQPLQQPPRNTGLLPSQPTPQSAGSRLRCSVGVPGVGDPACTTHKTSKLLPSTSTLF